MFFWKYHWVVVFCINAVNYLAKCSCLVDKWYFQRTMIITWFNDRCLYIFFFCPSTILFIYLLIFEQCFCSIKNSYGWVGNLIEQCNVVISKKTESRIIIIVIIVMMMTIFKAAVNLSPVFLYLIVLLLSGLSFTSIHESQDSRERGRLSI